MPLQFLGGEGGAGMHSWRRSQLQMQMKWWGWGKYFCSAQQGLWWELAMTQLGGVAFYEGLLQ